MFPVQLMAVPTKVLHTGITTFVEAGPNYVIKTFILFAIAVMTAASFSMLYGVASCTNSKKPQIKDAFSL